MLTGKMCVVIGGAKGFGRLILEEFAKRGCNVAFMDNDEESGEKEREYITACFGVDAYYYHGNLHSEAERTMFACTIIDRYERIDYLINNACTNAFESALQCNYDKPKALMWSCILGLYYFSNAFEEDFAPNVSIVNVIPSKETIIRNYGASYYKEVKKNTEILTKTLLEELGKDAHVYCVQPSLEKVKTPFGKPMDLADAVFFLCQERADFLNGREFVIDGSISKAIMQL